MKRQAPGAGELRALVPPAPRPTLEARGRLLFADDIVALLRGHKSRWYVNHNFLPAKKVKIGRDNAWWECDVLEAIDRNELTAGRIRPLR